MDEQSKENKLQRLSRLLQEFPSSLEFDQPPEWPEHELTMTQFRAMSYLQNGPQRMGDIGRHFSISLSSVTNLITRLEGKGLVERRHDLADRRVVICELTDEGRATISKLWRSGREQLVQIARNLSEDELDQVLAAFELLVRAARSHASRSSHP